MERIVDIIESIAHEKGLDINEVKNTVTVALVKTAKKIYGSQYEYDAEIDPATKTLKLYQKVLVVTPEDERLQEGNENFIAIKDAKEVDPEIEIGDELTYELPLDNLGRTAAATLQKSSNTTFNAFWKTIFLKNTKNWSGKPFSVPSYASITMKTPTSKSTKFVRYFLEKTVSKAKNLKSGTSSKALFAKCLSTNRKACTSNFPVPVRNS